MTDGIDATGNGHAGADRPVRVGVAGLGRSGWSIHAETIDKLPRRFQLVAVADADAQRRGEAEARFGCRAYAQVDAMLAQAETDLIVVATPSHLHARHVIAAMKAGKHVLCEKPLALDSTSAQKIADAAAKGKGIFMPAMCIRFWPEWAWLKQAVSDGRYGKVLDAQFHRVGAIPQGWFREGDKSGGAVLDLHVHDTDFIYYLFGKPNAVFSRGYKGLSGRVDALFTHYIYDNGPPAVFAEGNWAVDQQFPFNMRYRVNFERGTVEHNVANSPSLMIAHDGKYEPVIFEGDGYFHELSYFVQCCERGQRPTVVTVEDAVTSIRIVEAEAKSVETGQMVRL